jgi:hypothetical protein
MLKLCSDTTRKYEKTIRRATRKTVDDALNNESVKFETYEEEIIRGSQSGNDCSAASDKLVRAAKAD